MGRIQSMVISWEWNSNAISSGRGLRRPPDGSVGSSGRVTVPLSLWALAKQSLSLGVEIASGSRPRNDGHFVLCQDLSSYGSCGSDTL